MSGPGPIAIPPGQELRKAEYIFRTKHREAWQQFLTSELGQAFFAVYYSYKPPAAPSIHEHMMSYSLGRVAEYDEKFNLMLSTLTQPPFVQEEVPANYPVNEDGTEINTDMSKSGE